MIWRRRRFSSIWWSDRVADAVIWRTSSRLARWSSPTVCSRRAILDFASTSPRMSATTSSRDALSTKVRTSDMAASEPGVADGAADGAAADDVEWSDMAKRAMSTLVLEESE
eukprot:Amastigsp_a174475_309.p3 type:complete len:112 gc:universal Amastigsp_a174475_309:405-740(+)